MQRRQFLYAGVFSVYPIKVLTKKELENKSGSYICGNAEPLRKKDSSKWEKKHLNYFFLNRDLTEMSQSDWDSRFKLAFKSWSDVCDMSFTQIDNIFNADIVISVGNKIEEGFGEKGGILAWAYGPTDKGFSGVLMTKFDTAENWTLKKEEEGFILQAVAAHEIGHLLGLSHSKDESSLMFPYYRHSIIEPQKDDISKVRKLYGK
jgi:matrix metalloproteinase-27